MENASSLSTLPTFHYEPKKSWSRHVPTYESSEFADQHQAPIPPVKPQHHYADLTQAAASSSSQQHYQHHHHYQHHNPVKTASPTSYQHQKPVSAGSKTTAQTIANIGFQQPQQIMQKPARRTSSTSVGSNLSYHSTSNRFSAPITAPTPPRRLTPIRRSRGYSKRSRGASGSSSLRSTRGMEEYLQEHLDIQRVSGCAHFHYETVELGPIEISLVLPSPDRLARNFRPDSNFVFTIRVSSNGQAWLIHRCYREMTELDKQLHRCIYDRRYSRLDEFPGVSEAKDVFDEDLVDFMRNYFGRLSDLAGSLITCYPVLKWLELDNRGNRLLPAEETPINTPALAAAYVVKDYQAQAADELTLKTGDIISVIDMPPASESAWWKGKLTIVKSPRAQSIDNRLGTLSDSEDIIDHLPIDYSTDRSRNLKISPPLSLGHGGATTQFEVGFFPSHCVQIFGSQMKHVPEVLEKSYGGADWADSGTKPVFQRRGKLMTFLRGFLSNRPSRRHLKESGILQERVFGCDLAEHLENTGHDVPVILKSCSEAIEKHGVVDGVYRLSGVVSNIQRLRNEFDANRAVNLEEKMILQDIHCVGSLLKMYFRELPNPLFTYQLYAKFVESVEAVQEKSQRIIRLHEIIQQLPPPHYRTAEFLMRHLLKVGEAGERTGMHHQNLAIVWAPNLFRCRDIEISRESSGALLRSVNVQAVILEYLIRYADVIFSHKMPTWRTQSAQVTSTGNSSRRRQRPQSMACSPLSSPSPSKLIDLGEAQKKFMTVGQEKIPPGTGLPDLTNRKCIDVNGGPAAIEGKYHTVIDIPLRGAKRAGWRALFGGAKSRKPIISGPAPIADSGIIEIMHRAPSDSEKYQQVDHGPVYGSLQHVHMKGWDARVRHSRKMQQQRESEGEKQIITDGNRSLEDELFFLSQPELRPVKSEEVLHRFSSNMMGGERSEGGRLSAPGRQESFRNDVENGRTARERKERDSSSEYNRETSSSRDSTPMVMSSNSDTSSSATAAPSSMGNNNLANIVSPNENQLLLPASELVEESPLSNLIPNDWLPSKNETTFDVTLKEKIQPRNSEIDSTQSTLSLSVEGNDRNQSPRGFAEENSQLKNEQAADLNSTNEQGAPLSAMSDAGTDWSVDGAEAEFSPAVSNHPSPKATVFAGGLELNSPDLSENRSRSAEVGFSLFEKNGANRLLGASADQLFDNDRSSSSSIEGLLSITGETIENDDSMNATTDCFLVTSEKATKEETNRQIQKAERLEKEIGPIEPTILVVNNFDEHLAISGDEEKSSSSQISTPDNLEDESPFENGEADENLGVEVSSNADGRDSGKSVLSLGIFAREEAKLLEELREHKYFTESAEGQKETEIDDFLEEPLLTESEIETPQLCPMSVSQEDQKINFTFKIADQLAVTAENPDLQESQPALETVQQEIQDETPVSKIVIELNEEKEREISRESSLDSEARTLFDSVVAQAENTDIQGNVETSLNVQRQSIPKPILPARQRISFEDVNSMLESMENLNSEKPMASRKSSAKEQGMTNLSKRSYQSLENKEGYNYERASDAAIGWKPVSAGNRWNYGSSFVVGSTGYGGREESADSNKERSREGTEESSDSELRKSRYDNISSAESEKSLNSSDQQWSTVDPTELEWSTATNSDMKSAPTFSGWTEKDEEEKDSLPLSEESLQPEPKHRFSKATTGNKFSDLLAANKENRTRDSSEFNNIKDKQVASNPAAKVLGSVGRLSGVGIKKRVAIFESQPDSIQELGVFKARPAVAMTQSLKEIDFGTEQKRTSPASKKVASGNIYRSVDGTSDNELDSSPLYRKQREALLKEKQRRLLEREANEKPPRSSLIELADFQIFEKSQSEPPLPVNKARSPMNRERGFREAAELLLSVDGSSGDERKVQSTLSGRNVPKSYQNKANSEEYDNNSERDGAEQGSNNVIYEKDGPKDDLCGIKLGEDKRSSVVRMHFV